MLGKIQSHLQEVFDLGKVDVNKPVTNPELKELIRLRNTPETPWWMRASMTETWL